jgi:Tol biopolymer transport system component
LYDFLEWLAVQRLEGLSRDGVEPTELFVMNSDGSHKERLTHWQTWVRFPAWSPDGKEIAFVGLQRVGKSDNFKSAIYLINSDGTGLRQLTDIAIGPTWSPDGKVVAFVGWNRESYAVRITGENLRQLTGFHGGAPAWSPDGKSLAFTGLEGGSPEIFVLEVGTSAVRPLTHLKGFSTSPTWSPDGGQIAFAFDDMQSSRIFVMNASEANAHELLRSKSFHYYQPAWSPNGKEIAITAERNIGNPHSREHAVAPLAYRWIVLLDLETLTTHPLKELSSGHPSFARGK